MSYCCASDLAAQPFSARYGAMALLPLRLFACGEESFSHWRWMKSILP